MAKICTVSLILNRVAYHCNHMIDITVQVLEPIDRLLNCQSSIVISVDAHSVLTLNISLS